MAASRDVNDDNDVPPLEDMSELLQRVSELKMKQNLSKIDHQMPKTTFLEATENSEEVKIKSVQKLLCNKDELQQKIDAKNSQDVPQSSSKKHQGVQKPNQSFGGFKKGFLLSSAKKPDSKKSKKVTDIKGEKLEEVKKSNTEKTKDPLVFTEVQEALAAQMPLLKSKDWITEDLLSKVEKNPKLMKQLEDQRFSQALTAFQANPQQAMAAVQNDPEVNEFIKEFCGLLGDHFTRLGEKETKKKTSTKNPIETLQATSSRKIPLNNKDDSSQEENEKFQKIISDPEIREILNNQRIQHLIGVLKESPAVAQRTLAELGPEYHSKIQKLIEAGLLGVARK